MISMVSDFFFPQPGGVELHLYHLSQQLINLGHSVIIVTHAYGERKGVRTLTNGLKVYYVPYFVLHRESTFPSVFSFFPTLRQILIREQIQIVHGHASMSSFCHEALLHGRTMGLKTVFTDHSLFGFADTGSILGNKLLRFSLSEVGHVICVSHTCKENTVLRAALDPWRVSAIPNAIVAKTFEPEELVRSVSIGPDGRRIIKIIVISRLFANKGIDLLAAVIPPICKVHKNIQFHIGGSGPKQVALEQMRDQHQLHDRVHLLGPILHEDVNKLMLSGDIYLHTALTEAFGTVLVEAAACGLLVVSTKVGGIPEVLPGYMTVFADRPGVDELVSALGIAIQKVERADEDGGGGIGSGFHEEVRKMYCWEDVARRTEIVYNERLFHINNESGETDENNDWHDEIFTRMLHYWRGGSWAGVLFVVCVVVDFFVYRFLEWYHPRSDIDLAVKWPRKQRIVEPENDETSN